MGKSVELVNVMEYQASLSKIENPAISVLINTKGAPAEDLKIPAEFVKIAHESGKTFIGRWFPSDKWLVISDFLEI